MKQEFGYGIVPVKLFEGGWKVFIVKRNEGFWEFPKGHANPGETDIQAAIREFKEETGLDVIERLKEDPFIERYQYERDGSCQDKEVSYYLYTVDGNPKLQKEEIAEGEWVSFQEATQILTYDTCKAIATKVAHMLQ